MQGFLNSVESVFNTITIIDVLDMLIVAYLIYQFIALVRRTRAVQLIKGILVFVIVYFVASQLGFKTLNFMLDKVLQYGIMAIIVVFQPELRRALERVGRSRFGSLAFFGSKSLSESDAVSWLGAINDICTAVEVMSASRTGALIAIEMQTGLGEIITTGTVVDSAVTPELLNTIFYEGSPLHDGAVVVRGARVYAAGCYLPLSSNTDIGRDMGTRHRAALGLSENSDAIVIVVSEETGIISVAQNGVLVRKLDRQGLQRVLQSEILPKPTQKSIFTRIFKNEEK